MSSPREKSLPTSGIPLLGKLPLKTQTINLSTRRSIIVPHNKQKVSESLKNLPYPTISQEAAHLLHQTVLLAVGEKHPTFGLAEEFVGVVKKFVTADIDQIHHLLHLA